MGVQVFSPTGRYLRSLASSPADLPGFVIRDAGDGEHIYGVSLRGRKFVKLTLDGEVVLEISRDAIPRTSSSHRTAWPRTPRATSSSPSSARSGACTNSPDADVGHRLGALLRERRDACGRP